MKQYAFYLALGVVAACSSDPSTNDGGTDAGNDVTTGQDASNDVAQNDVTTTDAPIADAKNDAPITDAGTDAKKDAAVDGATLYTLTINDYLNWCNVSVNGADAGSNPPTYQFGPDASVALHGDTADSQLWYWGYWQAPSLLDGGKITNMDVTLKMNGNVTVLACCPDLNTPLSCP